MGQTVSLVSDCRLLTKSNVTNLLHFWVLHTAVCDPPCENGGQCLTSGYCSCAEGWTGKRCTEGITSYVQFQLQLECSSWCLATDKQVATFVETDSDERKDLGQVELTLLILLIASKQFHVLATTLFSFGPEPVAYMHNAVLLLHSMYTIEWTLTFCIYTAMCSATQCLHGDCVGGSCRCRVGWTGANCDQGENNVTI